MNTTARILLVGYYGYDNAGDELLAKKSITLLSSVFKHPIFTVLSTKRVKQDEISYIKRFSMLSLMIAILRTRYIVFGGGGLLQDKTSKKSLFYYLGILTLGWLFRKECYLIGQGIGPLESTFSKHCFAFLMRRMTHISVRDKLSYALLRRIGISPDRVLLATDLAYYRGDTFMPHPKASMVGFSFRPMVFSDAVSQDLKRFISTLDADMAFLEFHKTTDLSALKTFYYHSLPGNIKSVWDMNDILLNPGPLDPQLKLVIGMRFHALVFASLYHLPFLALVYDDKVKQLAKFLGQEYVDLRQKGTVYTELTEKLQKIEQNYEHYQNQLVLTVPKLIEQANLNKLGFK